MPDGEDRSRLTGTPNRATTPAQQGLSSAAAGPFVNRLRHEAEHRGEGKLARAQADAELLTSELGQHYAARFLRSTAPGRSRHAPGEAVKLQVLARQEYDASYRLFLEENLEEARRLVTTYAPSKVAARLPASTPPRKIGPSTKLSPVEAQLVIPSVILPGTAGGFYSAARDVVVIREDQVSPGAVAHELCHAYASSLWNEFIVALQLQSEPILLGKFTSMVRLSFALDEGVCSVLAQAVLNDWFAAPTRGGYQRPATAPQGRVGYLPDVTNLGETFIAAVDGTLGAPGDNIAAAYFGGAIVFTIDEAAPLESDVACGRRKSAKLVDLL